MKYNNVDVFLLKIWLNCWLIKCINLIVLVSEVLIIWLVSCDTETLGILYAFSIFHEFA